MGERIRDEGPAEDVRRSRCEQDANDCARTAEGCEAGSDDESEAGWTFAQDHQIEGHHDECSGDDDDFGQCELKELRVVDWVHCQLPLRKPSKRGEFRAGTMIFRSTCG